MKFITLLCFCVLLTFSGPARAELQDDVERLVAAWSSHARVQVLKFQIMERGGLRPLLIPVQATDPADPECTTVVVLGASSSNFLLRLPVGPPWQEAQLPQNSVAGAVSIRRCGARKTALSELAVEMRSPRAVLAVVVARSTQPLPSVVQLLPHRDPGPDRGETPSGVPQGARIASDSGPGGAPTPSGPRPIPGPLESRVASIKARAQREAAVDFSRRELHTGPTGSAHIVLRLGQGCHRIDALVVQRRSEWVPDIDLDVISIPGADLLGSDDSESTDASTSFCLGSATLGRVHITDGPPRGEVLLLHSVSDLPEGLPQRWGPVGIARIAEAIRRHHLRPPGRALIYESLGVQGATVLPLEIEPDGCYLVAGAVVRGLPTGFAISVDDGLQSSRAAGPEGAAAAFCANGHADARVELEATGAEIYWLLAVWQTGRLPLGVESQ